MQVVEEKITILLIYIIAFQDGEWVDFSWSHPLRTFMVLINA